MTQFHPHPTRDHYHAYLGVALVEIYRLLLVLAPGSFLRLYLNLPEAVEDCVRREQLIDYWRKAAEEHMAELKTARAEADTDELVMIHAIGDVLDANQDHALQDQLQTWLREYLQAIDIDLADDRRNWRSAINGIRQRMRDAFELARWAHHLNPNDFTTSQYGRADELRRELEEALDGFDGTNAATVANEILPIVREVAMMFRNAWSFAIAEDNRLSEETESPSQGSQDAHIGQPPHRDIRPMRPREISEILGCTHDTLATYVKDANVVPPGRGKRNHVYASHEVEAIMQRAARAVDAAISRRATQWLEHPN